MDKLAPAIDWIKQNGFWLANGLLLLLMIGIWFMQTGTLKEQQVKNEKKIKSNSDDAERIMSKKPDDITDASIKLHPNRTTQEGMQAELEQLADSIIAAWELRVKTQEGLLVFPELDTPRFDEIFGQYNPPETFPVEYADSEIEGLLSLYNSKIKNHMLKLCGKEGVRTNWRKDPENYEQTEEEDKAGIGRGKDEAPVFNVTPEDAARFAVLWSDVNQKLWYDKLTVFQDRDDHNKSAIDPTPLQCYMLQQDLWVLEAMFNVIKELNGDSASVDTSAIKQIAHIGIGREGTGKLGELHPVDKRLAPDVDETLNAGGLSGSSESSGGVGQGVSQHEMVFSEEEVVAESEYGNQTNTTETTETRLPPFHNMYVDTNFEPIASEEVLKVVKGTELPESNLELIIAKRLPVRIGLRMDERKISDFMAACVNSPFSFEIQQVRINRHNPGGEVIKLGGGDPVAIRRKGNDDGAKSFDDVSSVETRTNYDVNVEFFGIIKIYNPVRADLIRQAAGIEEAQGAPDSASNRSGATGIRVAG